MSDGPRPLYLTSDAGPLFAWFYPPADRATGLGIVLCRPMGSELMCSYRAMRELALAMAEGGLAVMAIDYHGTGDSPGYDDDDNRVEQWMHSIDVAIDALHARGFADVGVVGVRVGATLAAAVASRRGDLACAVLWAPCKTGKAYAREMKMLALSEAPASSEGGDASVEAGGFLLTAATVGELAAVDLAKLGKPVAPRILLIARDDMPADDKLAAALGATSVAWPGYSKMMLAPHYAEGAPDTYAKIVAWLREAKSQPVRNIASDAVEPVVEFIEGKHAIRERAFLFGTDKTAMFGVISEPASGPRANTAVIIPNTGANYHVGPNRMYVRMARRWAALGYTVLRFDLTGIGDSDLRAGAAENAPYTDYGADDLAVAVTELCVRAHVKRVVAIGLCSGAYVAFHASLRGTPLTAEILVNPQAFYWKAGDSLDAAASVVVEKMQNYKNSARDWGKWKNLLTGKANYQALSKILTQRARDFGETRLKRVASRLGLITLTDDLGRDMRAIADRGVATLLVYSKGDAGIEYMKARAGDELARLTRDGRVRTEIVDGADHTFTAQLAQKKLVDTMTTYLQREHT